MFPNQALFSPKHRDRLPEHGGDHGEDDLGDHGEDHDEHGVVIIMLWIH